MARRTRRRWPGLEPGYTFTDEIAGEPAGAYFRVSSNPDDAEQKSVDDQESEYWPWAERSRVKCDKHRDVFKDDDRSASMYAIKDRPAFRELRAAIEAERYKVIWFWATSRQTRGDIPIDDLMQESVDHGVLWSVNGRLLNPANGEDAFFLEVNYLIDKQMPRATRKDVIRGLKGNAYGGKPHGRLVYGYRRVYDDTVRDKRGKPKFVRDVPDVFDGNGRAVENSPAYIVREIYDRIQAEVPVNRIARSLQDRRIPAPQPPRKCRTCLAGAEGGTCKQGHLTGKGGRCPQGHRIEKCLRGHEIDGCQWTSHAVLFIARNPFYIGSRIHQSESWRVADRHDAIIDMPEGIEPKWDTLVGAEQWWTVQRILSDPERPKFQPGIGTTLLAGVARCGECGWPLHLHNDHSRVVVPYYVCSYRSHVGIRKDWLDAYVEDRVVSWLADPQLHAYLWGRREDDSATARAARADIERLEHQIEECRTRGEDPDADAVFWERRSVALAAKLAEARKLAHPPSLSPALAGMAGPDAADKWWALRRDNLPAAKQLIKAVADIRVHKGIRGGDRRHAVIDPGRISWAWLTGPGDHERVFGEAVPRPRDRAAEALRAAPEESDHALARKLGTTTHRTVAVTRRELEDAGEIPVIRRKGRQKPVNLGYQPRSVT